MIYFFPPRQSELARPSGMRFGVILGRQTRASPGWIALCRLFLFKKLQESSEHSALQPTRVPNLAGVAFTVKIRTGLKTLGKTKSTKTISVIAHVLNDFLICKILQGYVCLTGLEVPQGPADST